MLALAVPESVLAQTQRSRPASGADARLRTEVSDYNKTVIEGALLGAIVGGAGAAVLGLVTGDRNVAANAVAGILAGGFSGLVAGKNMADNKQEQAAAEASYDTRIQKTREANQKLGNIVKTAEALVSQRRMEVAALEAADSSARSRLRTNLADDDAQIQIAIDKAKKVKAELASDIDARQAIGTNISRLQIQQGKLRALQQSL
jgi:uncharacterized protein YcfJ